MSEKQTTENVVKLFLAEAVTAWNQRDFEHFLSLFEDTGYGELSSNISFTNRNGSFVGRESIKRAYAPFFGRGNLGLYLHKVFALSPNYLHVVGAYTREIVGQPRAGYFTLVLYLRGDGHIRILTVHES